MPTETSFESKMSQQTNMLLPKVVKHLKISLKH